MAKSNVPHEAPPSRPQPNLAGAKRLKKLTAKIVFGDRLVGMNRGDPVIWLGDFYCYVTGSKTESSPYGDYQRFIGDFRSVDVQTGEVLMSSTAIFPGIASDYIEAAMHGVENVRDAASRNVMIAFRLGIEYDDNKARHKFVLMDIVPPSHASPVDMFMAEALGLPSAGERIAIADHSGDPGAEQGGEREAAD